MTQTTNTSKSIGSRRGIRWVTIAIGFLALIAILTASLLFAPPAFFFTSLLKKAVYDQTGRELTVTNSRYHVREIVTVELSGVELGRPGSKPGSSPLTVRKIIARVPLRSLLDGKPDVLSVELDAPVLNLVRQADGSGNWQTGPASIPSSTTDGSAARVVPPLSIRNGTLLYADEGQSTQLRFDAINAALAADSRYGGAAAKGSLSYNNEPLTFDLAISDTAAALAGRSTPLALSIDSRVLKAKVSGEGAIGETPMLTGEIDASSPSARELAAWLGFENSVPSTAGALSFEGNLEPQTSATRVRGSLVLGDAPLTYDLALASLREAMGGRPAALKGTISGQGLVAQLDGTAWLGSDKSYAGAVTAKTDAIGSIAARFGSKNSAVNALGPGSLTGTVNARAGEISFSETAFDADGRTGAFTGVIALDGPRPRISGNLDVSQIDLDALLGRTPAAASLAPASSSADEGFESTYDVLSAELDAIENPLPPSAAPALTTATAPASWSTAPIDLKAMRAVDLDLDLAIPVVKFGQLPLTNARVKAKLDNGELAAGIDQITIGAGSGSGTVSLKARGASHDGALALKLQNVDAEPITTELSGRPLLKGNSTVDIVTRASGRSPAELVTTLDGSARIELRKGQLRGWDLGEMVAQLWNYKGWGYTPSRNTPVDELTATYTIKNGTVTSAPDLTMKGPTAGLRSVGNIVVPRRLIDQNIDVQNLFFNIVIKGDWTKKLWIGPAFLAGLEPAPGAALDANSPPANAMPKALPADLTARIERMLTEPATSARLSDAQKSFLNALLAGGKSGL